MAGVHSYPLLVELEQTNIPRLKIKLVKYFQSKKSNGGGECEVEYENGSRTAIVWFQREEDQRNVLAKESHQISLEKGVLKLTVRLPTEEKSSQETPSDKFSTKSAVAVTDKLLSTADSNPTATVPTEETGRDDDTADGEPCSNSAVLGNISDCTNQQFLQILVENIVKSHDFTLEVLPDISSAVVTFQSRKEIADFLTRSHQNMMFIEKGLSARILEVTKQVLVDGIQNYSEEDLQHYFEIESGDVESVIFNKTEQSAIITFKDHRAVKNILKKHSIKGEDIRVYPFYKSLGRALCGKDKPSLKLSAAIAEPINSFAQTVPNFKCLKFHPHSEAWEESEKKIRQALMNENVIVVPDKDSGILSGTVVSETDRLKKEEINAASKVIFDAVLALKRQNLELDKNVLELLKDEQQEELTDALLTSHQINAAFEISGNRVQLLAVSDRDLSHAQDHLGQLLTSQYINVEDSNVLKKPEWQQLVSLLEQANSKPCRTRINTTAQQVVVSGYKDSVIKVQHQLGDFLTQNAHIEETVVVKANAVVEYLKHFNTSWMEKVKDKVRVSYRNEAICLSGSRVNVTHCKTVVEGAVSAVVFDSLSVYKSGVKKLFQENEAMYVSSIKNITGCLVQLVDKNGDFRQIPKPLYKIKTPKGVEIAVCKADMCSYPMQAIVNPSNQDLKHSTGLAAALVQAAGPQLQDECDKIKSIMGQLKPGDCVITDARGQLCCQKVIHAVGPKYEKDKLEQASAQLSKAVKGSLELAEIHGCVSVALPSIGRGLGCFSHKQCELTIVKAVKEYCDEKFDDITLQKIHFVNNDDTAVQDMVAAVKQEFGNHGVTHSQQGPTIAHKPPVFQPTGSDMYLYHVETNEGLDIVLKKGNIEFSMTEVIVNTVPPDLNLDRGTVSKAILRAAGPKLQQLINAQGATGNLGEIIVTEGCQLYSKKVFHAIAPHWDKDHGTGEKILRGIFKDCLDMAEDNNLTSISLPAIGTGNLGFPIPLVASLMLDSILEFSKKKHPKHLNKVVMVIYPGDTQNIKAFSEELKKFGNAPGGSSSTQSQGGHFSKIISTSDMHETKMGNVTIQVVTGDITKETTDIIVSSSNENFTLKSGVSKAILEAAGKVVELECHNLGAKSNPGMIMTQPGNLKCKKILHLVGQTDPVKINKLVKDALQMCVKTSYTSVSFPAIGTGQGNVQARLVADAMLDAVTDVMSQNISNSLTTIRIVIFQKPMLKDFHSSMQQREAADPDSKDLGGWNWGWTKIKSLFTGGSTENPKTEKDVVESLKVEATCFHICGDTQANVDLAKKLLHDKIFQARQTIKIEDNGVLRFSDEDRQKITDMQKTMGISIKIESSKPKATLIIEGLSNDVLRANSELSKMLSKNRDENVPEHWQHMPAKTTCQAFAVQAKTSEYDEILKLFQASCNRTVTKIERIQNPGLWKSLQLKKRDMEVRNGHQNNERRLFHGTCDTTVPIINDRGFNRSYAGKNAALYGNGTYFAVNASYSANDTYSKPNQNGEKFMYVCRVLTGDFTLGQKGMVTPPAKKHGSTDLYDSVVDNVANPTMFVVFHDTQAYPEYLITFK
ncbi:unnamed protein product [Oreochromis niloticus]|nr:unnamed protein product [Mustela putorius furo]